MENKIVDYIYGEFELEDVLIELINCDAVQRLKHIHQVGATYLIKKELNVNRLEHSIGVMLLIRLLGGSLKEQIAGLLHDISHTAFSHVIDFVFNNSDEDYHELIFDEVVINSKIPYILNKYGYDFKEILENEEQWTILERKAPRLCADRVDYTLRDMYKYGFTNKNEINEFLKNIQVVNGEIVTKDIESARWFLELYYTEVIDFFMNPINGYSYDKLSKAIKIAIDENELNLKDILKTDNEVIDILNRSKNNKIISLMKSLNKNVKLRINEDKYDIFIKGKTRLIDPGVGIRGKVYSLSELDNSVELINTKAKAKMEKGVYIEIL
ncbi:HD domain-containing protein [Paraclostridium bifermentans]|uniref:HD domain-containing protein n=1 Tax=Paraclostridium bifermentans TaxID=1490 RepID=UPI0004244872|nr:HD domain-containing protein [Paraclostridium bifermentans]MCR1874292.1 HD domain-containing protein [Paraclostridium bifermentans]